MKSAKRILILSSDAGFGHRSSALAVAAALEEKYAGQCQVEVVNPLNERRVPALLRRSQQDYDRIVRNRPGIYQFGYRLNDLPVASAVLSGSLTVLLFEGIRLILQKFRPDVVVVTFPLYHSALNACYAVANRHIPTITVVTDLAEVHRLWFHRVADVCAVATERVAAVAYQRRLTANKVQITGLPVNPAFAQKPADKAALRQQLGWEPGQITILAVGSKRVGRLSEFLRPLNTPHLPIQLAIVTGGDDAAYRELHQTAWQIPTQLYNFVENMPQLMQAADCLVSKAGGLILTEGLACGLPQIVIDAIPGQETGNLDYVVGHGAAAFAPQPEQLRATVERWLGEDGRLLHNHAQNAVRLGRPYAAYNVAALAWEAAQHAPYPTRRTALAGYARLPDDTSA
ncbi:MAG: glycosyltransferase [Candidatus Promineifilaceae bacterium]